MEINVKEVVDYIEASNNVIDSQMKVIEGLKKQASEKDARIKTLETKSEKREKVASISKESAQVATAGAPKWGKGERKEAVVSTMRPSEKKLYERFGIPVN